MKIRIPARLGRGPLALCMALAALPVSAQPVIDVQPSELEVALSPGGVAVLPVHVGNLGDAGSPLSWSVSVEDPYLSGRSIDGSTFVSDPQDYPPGGTQVYLLTVTNGSIDYEWISGITLDFPPGCNVISSTHFVGGSGGILVSDYSTGDGAMVTWSDPNGPWGNIYGGESASATITVAFDASFYANILVPWTLTGDGYGGEPHVLPGKLTLLGPWGAGVDILEPNGGEIYAVGETHQVRWTSWGTLYYVDLDLSRDGGQNWEALARSQPAGIPFDWVTEGPLSADCLLRVADVDGACEDTSSTAFTIHRPVDWLSLSILGGDLPGGEVDTLLVTVDATGVSPDYDLDATLRFSSNDPLGDVLVPVRLHMGATGVAPAPAPAPALDAWPNPFNPSTLLSFSLADAGPVRLEILDASGRRVRVLTAAVLPAGEHRARWDGRDDDGRRMASGVYLARLRSPDGVAGRKLIVLK